MKVSLYRVLLVSAALLFSACSHGLLHDQDGHAIDLTTHPEKWLVVHYWAPWCSVCQKELPEINQFYLTHAHQVLVYGFDYDAPQAKELIAIRKEKGIDFPLLVEDPQSLLGIKENIQALPITFIYNPNGELVHVLQGPQTVKQLNLMVTG